MTTDEAHAIVYEAAQKWLAELDEYIIPGAADGEERTARENEAGALGEAFHTLRKATA